MTSVDADEWSARIRLPLSEIHDPGISSYRIGRSIELNKNARRLVASGHRENEP